MVSGSWVKKRTKLFLFIYFDKVSENWKGFPTENKKNKKMGENWVGRLAGVI